MSETEETTMGPLGGPCSSSGDQSSPSPPITEDGPLMLGEPPKTMISMDDDVYLLDGQVTHPVEKVTQDGGVLKSIVQQGKGPIVPLHAHCLVHYTGRIVPNGDIFMNTRNTGERGRGEPVHIVAGRDAIRKEKGLHEVVGTMRVGEVCHVWVSPEYGYGADGNFSFPSIPPNVSLSYSVQLMDFEEPPSGDGEEARFLTYEERLEAATRRRLEGNAMYASSRLDEAMLKYESALAYLDDDFIMQLYEFHYDKAMEEKVHVLLNISACRLKQEQYHAVIEVTSEVLSHDQRNVKALYRRGVARRKLGQTAAALEDLESAKSISEKLSNIDAGIVREIAAVRKDIKEQSKVQGVLYKAMMQGTVEKTPQETTDVPENNRQQQPTSRPSIFHRCINWLILWFLECVYRPFRYLMGRQTDEKTV